MARWGSPWPGGGGSGGPQSGLEEARAREFHFAHLVEKYLLSICLGPMLGTGHSAADMLDVGAGSQDPT